MFSPTRRGVSTTKTTRSLRFAVLIAVIAIAGTALATTSSSANSLSRLFFAKAASVLGGNAPTVKAAHVDEALETAVAPVETSSSTMTIERRNHTATRLADGRVLIAGGENANGLLNQAEIYDPAAATFSTAGNMSDARADHSATLLADGRVLIAGGRNVGGALASTEIFDPTTGTFSSGPAMGVARAGHSATLLADGRLLIAGGDATGRAEILNASLTGSSSAGAMSGARSLHSAALLQDGRVLLVGGRDANGNDLNSGEIFDTAASSFSTVDSSLRLARVQPHLRVLFDGKVQIIGGNNDGSMEVYDPVYEIFGAYAHVLPESDPCTGLSAQILASQTRAALFHNGQTDPLLDRSGETITELNGQALVLGGADSSGAVLNSSALLTSSAAAITTDKMEYAPGETAHISGRGFQPGETVRLKIHEDPHTPQERGLDVVADGDGSFTGDYLVMDYDLNMKFIVGARGLTSGVTAQTTFTDARNLILTFAGTGSGTVTVTPSTGTVSAPVACGGSGTPQASQTVSTTCLPNITTSDNGATVTFNAVANAGSTFAGWSGQAGLSPSTCTGTTNPCSAVLGGGPTLTVTFNNATVNTTTTVANASATFGDTSVTLNAAVTPASGPAVNNGSVTFTVKQGATTIGVATTDNTVVAGAASVSYALPAGTNAGSYTIQASYTPGTGFNASSGTGSLTINKRNTLTTVSSSLNPSTFGESVSFTATVVGTGAGAGNPSGGSVQFKIDGSNFGAPVALAGGSATSGSTTTLTVGNHTVEAVFTSSDTNFNDSNDLLDGGQNVNKRNTLTTVSSTLNPSTFGESVSFSATVVGTGAGSGNPSGGSVQFKIDGSNFGAAVPLAGGSASSGSISTLSAGNHTVEAVFTSSDTNFNDSNDLLDGGQNVNKRNTLTTISSTLNPSTFGESVSFSATVVGTGAGAGNPSGGSVQFKIDGSNFGAPVALSGGSASSGSISTLTAGNHTVEAVFTSSDTNFNDSNDLLDGGQQVNKRNTLTTVSSTLNPSTFGESVSFSATVVGTGAGAGNPSGGSVQFKIDGSNFGAPIALSGGSASSGSISTLSAGNHTVEAIFTSSDTNFNDSNDLLDGGQQVNKRNTLTTVSSTLNPSTFGESVSFSATVVGTGAGAGNPSGGSVQFKIDGSNFGAAVPLAGGSASSGSISTLSAGNHTVEAVFTSADTNFNDSNDLLDGGQQVNKRNTLTTVSSTLNPSTFGDSVSFSATVVGTGAGAGNPSGGSVQFKIDGSNFGAAVALAGGSASSSSISTLTAGNHTVEAIFTSSDTNFNDSNDLLDGGQQVNKRDTLTTVSSSLNPSTFGDSVSFTATVVGTGAGSGNPSGGSVQFKIDGSNFGAAVPLSGGSASSGSISTLTAGNHTVEAVFTSSDTNFNDSNDLLDGGQQVNKRDTLTTVSSSLNPSTFGDSVSFTATVVGTGAGSGNPSGGSVQFKIDGSNFGAAVPLSGGSASSGSISTLTAGNHTVEAIFTSSDTNFNDSNDLLDGGQQVNKRNTLTTVSSTLNPSTFGESVSFSATVVGTGAGAGNPSGGSVQFKIDGGNFGAPVALAGGSASSGSISTLTAGNHTVEAVFTSSDTNFNDSNDLLDGGQQVNKRATLTTTSSSLNPSTYGQNVTFTATVVGTGPGAGNPTGGSVQFKLDGSNFGAPVTLSAGSASLAINSLTAGNHTIDAVFTSSDTNFADSHDLLDGGQNVNKALLTITASSHTITFNDPVPTITASYSGFVLGEGPDNLTTKPTCSTTYTVGSLIGTYPTKCENAVSSNYTFTYVNGTVTVLTACSAFNGFLMPIGGAVENMNGGSFANPVRSFKLSSTIPVKFSAICFGAPLVTGIHTLQAIKYSNSTTSDPPIDATPTDAATDGNQFRLTDGEWHYNLSTKGLGNNGQGVWLLKATLFDGSTYTVWVSIKK